MDFPQLTMTLPDGREESIMKRTTLVRARSTTLHPCSLTSSMQIDRLLGLFFHTLHDASTGACQPNKIS